MSKAASRPSPILVDQPQLRRVPGRAVGRPDHPALAGAVNALQPAAEREIDQLDVMHRHVRARIAAGDPFGELPAGDAVRLQQRAIAVVDVRQLAVDDQRAQLFVIGIEQLVIDDLGQHLLPPGQRDQLVQLGQRQDRRLFDQHVLAGLERRPGGGEMPIVGRGDADKIDRPLAAIAPMLAGTGEQLLDRTRLDEADKSADPAGRSAAILFGPLAGAAGHGGQLDPDDAEGRIVERPLVNRLEERPIRFVENHPQPDHAGAKHGGCRVDGGWRRCAIGGLAIACGGIATAGRWAGGRATARGSWGCSSDLA